MCEHSQGIGTRWGHATQRKKWLLPLTSGKGVGLKGPSVWVGVDGGQSREEKGVKPAGGGGGFLGKAVPFCTLCECTPGSRGVSQGHYLIWGTAGPPGHTLCCLWQPAALSKPEGRRSKAWSLEG